jgi:hypothetical protein
MLPGMQKHLSMKSGRHAIGLLTAHTACEQVRHHCAAAAYFSICDLDRNQVHPVEHCAVPAYMHVGINNE